MKPRLFKDGATWACTSDTAIGYGVTPARAYDSWLYAFFHSPALRKLSAP